MHWRWWQVPDRVNYVAQKMAKLQPPASAGGYFKSDLQGGCALHFPNPTSFSWWLEFGHLE